MSLNVEKPHIDLHVGDKFNQIIQKHNQISRDFDIQVNQSAKILVEDMIANSADDYLRLDEIKHAKDIKQNSLEVDFLSIENKITQLKSEIQEYLDPIELNKDLQMYLGHNDIRLEVVDGGYCVMRNNNIPADFLSEGEKTALALLYFLKSLQDDRFNMNEGIIVIDDPISSLDSNALHLAFGYIKARTKNAGQLFIFTHNFTFFGLVKKWFQNLARPKKTRQTGLYALNRVSYDDKSKTMLQKLDPLLEKFESEYQYLFKCIYDASVKESIDLQEAYLLSNASRRLLEAFLSFRFPSLSTHFYRKLERVEFNEAKKIRIYQFINIQSHYNTIDPPMHYQSVSGELKGVLNDILELMNTEDPNHFKAMKQLCSKH